MNKDAIQKLRSKNKELRLDLAKKKAVSFAKNVFMMYGFLKTKFISVSSVIHYFSTFPGSFKF